MADGERVSGIRISCVDGMTCGGIRLKAGWICRWPLEVHSLPGIGYQRHLRWCNQRMMSYLRYIHGLGGAARHRLGKVVGKAPASAATSPTKVDDGVDELVHNRTGDYVLDFEMGMTEADYLTLGISGPSQPTLEIFVVMCQNLRPSSV
ncbi:hypothetical protein PIB30_024164 [Stylosanthes scabra]|uniref:Uncharacterized protein n=1 Tax=Stylosanthes scabra TaxID=79078 RepID=A0ABU6YBR4_9FABA|nr:hypothetical protein [Stylosanthes scabra]